MSKMQRYYLLTAFLVCIVSSPITLRAQSYGEVSGTISDSSKALIPNANVTIRNLGTGLSYTAKSGASGLYVFPSLPPGVYGLRVEAASFATQVQDRVVVDVASPVTANFNLLVGSDTQVVDVLAEGELLQKTTAELGTVLQNKPVQDLPTNGRDFSRFALLSPGAIQRTNTIAEMSFNGLHIVDNAFTIDGVDATRVDQPYLANGNERGSHLLTGSLETISEFKVQTTGFPAEYGRASGSIVNIVTKSGTSSLHGTVYDYFRNDLLDARNYYATLPRKPEFRYNDFGASIGGPIVKKNTFFFLNFEGTRQIIGVTASGLVPSALLRQQILAQSPQLQPLLNQIPLGTSSSSNVQVDNYAVSKGSRVTENTGSVRIDHTFSAKDSMFGRLNINDTLVHGPLFATTPSNFGVNDTQDIPVRTTNAALHEQHLFSSSILNDLLIGAQRYALDLNANSNFPKTTIAGLTITPGNESNTLTHSDLFQLGDNVTLVKGRHTLKWGGSIYRIDTIYSGITSQAMSFAAGPASNPFQNLINDQLSTVTQAAADPGHRSRGNQFGLFVQDTWQAGPNLSVNYGLRWDYEPPVYDQHASTQIYDPRTGTLAPAGTSYYDRNLKDFQPRLGVAYSPTSRIVVRAAFGVYTIMFPVGLASNGGPPTNNLPGNINLTRTAYPTLSYPFTSFIAQASTVQGSVMGYPRFKPDIYSIQRNVSISNQLTRSTALTLAYVGNHGVNEDRSENVNLLNPATGRRPNPNFPTQDITLAFNNGQSSYNGFQASLLQHASSRLDMQINYAWAHTIDDVNDRGFAGTAPQDINNLKAERGNGSGDIRHAFNVNALYSLPFGSGQKWMNGGSGLISSLVGGWQINTLGTVRTGVPGTVLISTNTFGNGNFTNQRPNLTGAPIYSATKSINGWLNPAAFAIPADGTFGNAPRNEFVGPKLVNIDGSLIKNTRFTESKSLQFRAEVFNVVNHPNFAGPNATFSPGSASFGKVTSTLGNTIGTGTSRQIQLALKFIY